MTERIARLCSLNPSDLSDHEVSGCTQVIYFTNLTKSEIVAKMDHVYEISKCNKKYIDAYYALSQSSAHGVVHGGSGRFQLV
jgi:hypothetical protein